MVLSEILSMEDRQDAYIELSNLYYRLGAQDREEIQTGWDWGLNWEFPNVWKLACTVNEKYSPMERILSTLLYFDMDIDSDIKSRESIITLAIIYNSCSIAGLNPDKIFKQVSKCSRDSVGNFLDSFANRPENSKSLEAFLLDIVINENGEKELKPDW